MRTGLSKVATYANPAEAEMACEFIKSNGIDAEIDGGVCSDAFGSGNPLTVKTLFVETDRVPEVRKLLSESSELEIQADDHGVTEDHAPIGKRYDGYFETTWNSRERAAESAYRAAIFGLVLPFASWWAAWKLCQVAGLNEPLNARCARRAKIATAVMIVPAVGWAAFVGMIMSPH